jgi:hypothetical protein
MSPVFGGAMIVLGAANLYGASEGAGHEVRSLVFLGLVHESDAHAVQMRLARWQERLGAAFMIAGMIVVTLGLVWG